MYQDLITKIINKRKAAGMAIQPPGVISNINNMRNECRTKLLCDVPDEYIQFLTMSDGLNWNSLFIYASETMQIANTNASILGFVEANLIWQEYEPQKDFIIFGDSDLDKYVYNFTALQYQTIDRVSLEVVEEMSSFDELIASALKSVLN